MAKKKTIVAKEDFNYATGCSGIECFTYGIERKREGKDLSHWKPKWFAQYDPEHTYKSGADFASAVLAHHYPHVPNLGDMCNLRKNKTFIDEQIDLFCAGTPCTGFSLAGLRQGLDDERSNLAYEFVRILMLRKPGWFLWENVPGVLSTGRRNQEDQTEEEYDEESGSEGDDFANILSAFTGRNIATQDFPKAGVIEGTFYSVAYRIFDSQYFGIAQRRRRIFVVGYIGNNWRPPFAVLFERGCLRGDITKSRSKRKKITPTAVEGFSESSLFRKVNFGQYTEDGIVSAIKQRDFKDAGDLVVQPSTETFQIDSMSSNSMKSSNPDSGIYKIKKSVTITTSQPTAAQRNGGLMIVQTNPVAIDVRNFTETENLSNTIQAGSYGHGYANNNVNPVLYDVGQITAPGNRSNPQEGDPSHTISSSGKPPLMVTDDILRRLTPVEVERLFGFHDDFTNIPWRGKKTSPDSLRYRALGNGMVIDVMEWLAIRIDTVNTLLKTLPK